jgi:dephospho-CoA kinase
MKKIGVTGGIGSGKSLVCEIFALQGIPVYQADIAAKTLMHKNEDLKNELTKEFGNIYNETGELQRSELAKKVFGNLSLLQKLNSIVHPYVIRHSEEWESKQSAPYVLREAAILFESGTNTGLDYVITVTAPVDVRIKRILARDNRSEEEIRAIISNQMSDEEKAERSDFVIVNDDVTAVFPQVWKLHNIFCNGR